MIQNGAKSSSIIEIIESDNFAEIKSKMLKAEQAQDEYAQQMEQMKGEQQKELLAMQDELAAKQHERELEKIDRKGEWDLRKSELTAYGMDDGGDADRISEAAEIGLKQQELGLKSRELDIKETDSQRKAATDRYKADKQVEVAKMRPKPTTKK
jgi:hypothetical protein